MVDGGVNVKRARRDSLPGGKTPTRKWRQHGSMLDPTRKFNVQDEILVGFVVGENQSWGFQISFEKEVLPSKSDKLASTRMSRVQK